MSDQPSPVDPPPAVRVIDLEVPVHFDLGDATMTVGQYETMQAGFVFELGRDAAEAVAISVNGTRIGKGELVRIGDRLGVRVVEMLSHAIDNA